MIYLWSVFAVFIVDCQSAKQIYYHPCGRELVKTDSVGIYRCSLGHEEHIFVKEGADVKLLCRHPIASSELPEDEKAFQPKIKGRIEWGSILMATAVLGLTAVAASGDGGSMTFPNTGFTNSSNSAKHKIMIFGGEGHKVYLGCLSCDASEKDSIFNESTLGYGYGSHYKPNSIWYQFGQYGSTYSTYSVCNPAASDPPVIVDENGNFYGRLTQNKYHSQATRDQNLIQFVDEVVCGN